MLWLWTVSCVLATALLIGSIVMYSKLKIKEKKADDNAGFDGTPALIVLLAFWVLTAIILRVPTVITDDPAKGIFIIYDALQIFSWGSDSTKLLPLLLNLPSWLRVWYRVLSTIIYLFGPILVVGTLLDFIKGFWTNIKWSFVSRHSNADFYVFSSLKRRTLQLAKSIKAKDKTAKIVFAGADAGDNNFQKLCEDAQKIGGIILKKDILNLNFNKSTYAFFLDDEEIPNVRKAIEYIEKNKSREDVECFIFSESIFSESLLNAYRNDTACKVKIRRVNLAKSTIFNDLYQNGDKIFNHALEEGKVKHINAIVVGDEKYAAEMARNLTWFCQMPGYFLKIDYFGTEGNVYSRFKATCPELVDKSGTKNTDQDACYELNIHDIDVNSYEFDEEMAKLDTPTFIFVAMGDDMQNIEVSTRIAMLACRKPGGEKAYFQTIVRNDQIAKNDCKIKYGKKTIIDILTLGSFSKSYNFEEIFQSKLEEAALARHCLFSCSIDNNLAALTGAKLKDAIDNFYRNEYFYYSSVASEIHTKFKRQLNVFGIGGENPDNVQLYKLEHRRWSAYVRSVGYIYNASRNDTAKQHRLLINFDDLEDKDKLKDEVKISEETLATWRKNCEAIGYKHLL